MSLQYRKISMLYLVQVQACLKDCRELIAAPHYQRNIDGLMERINETMNGADVSSADITPEPLRPGGLVTGGLFPGIAPTARPSDEDLEKISLCELIAERDAYRQALETGKDMLEQMKSQGVSRHIVLPAEVDDFEDALNRVFAQYNATPEKK